jgi:hypothetical protein
VVSSGGTLPEILEPSRRRRVIAAVVVSAVALLAVAALWVVPSITVDTNPATGAITIESTPTSASVRLDGALVGETPITMRAVAGTHRVTVSKAGFTEASSSVETKNGETAKLSLALSPVPAPKAPPEPAASGKIASDDKVPAGTNDSGGQGKPKQRAAWRPPKAKPVPTARPAPKQPNIRIIDESDESSQTKVKVDVIE